MPRILIANIHLLARTGTEIVVRDLALGLARRGHEPLVYAVKLGAPAEELRARGIFVTDDMHAIAEPDVIHGHHNLPFVDAMERFRECPAIWMSHDWRHWWDQPPHMSAIHRYVAIDRTRRDFLVARVAKEKVTVLLNAVDLARVPPRAAPLPDMPRRVVAFTKTSAHIGVLRETCAQLGIAFDAFGAGAGRVTADPEALLSAADVVFATGRAALEGVCAGAAVIVGDARGLAGMVTTANLDELRALNFGSGAFTQTITPESVRAELGRYDRADAEAVTSIVRREADLERLLDRLEVLYAEAIASNARSTARELRDARAMVRALQSRVPWARRLLDRITGPLAGRDW
jgi:Glycosyltransferase Family 4